MERLSTYERVQLSVIDQFLIILRTIKDENKLLLTRKGFTSAGKGIWICDHKSNVIR